MIDKETSIVPDTDSLGGVDYIDLSNEDLMRFHGGWYQSFMQDGNLKLAMWNIIKEYNIKKNIIKEKHT